MNREKHSAVFTTHICLYLYTENKYYDRYDFVQLPLVLNKLTAGSTSRPEK